jgi:hypothetical protein
MTTNHKPQHTRILEILQSSYAHQIDRIMSLQKKKTNDKCFTFLKGLLQTKDLSVFYGRLKS